METTVSVSKETRDRINSLKRGDESQEEFMERLVSLFFDDDELTEKFFSKIRHDKIQDFTMLRRYLRGYIREQDLRE